MERRERKERGKGGGGRRVRLRMRSVGRSIHPLASTRACTSDVDGTSRHWASVRLTFPKLAAFAAQTKWRTL